MKSIIDPSKIEFGYGVQTRKKGFLSKLVIWIIGGKYSHDAPFIHYEGQWWVGHEKGTIGKLQSIEDFNKEILEGKIVDYQVLGIRISPQEGKRANDWWLNNVHGRLYDYAGAIKAGLSNAKGFSKLILKLLFGWLNDRIEQWEWAWYCTENWQAMIRAGQGGRDRGPWNKEYPTPRTTSKRVEQGLIEDVTKKVLK